MILDVTVVILIIVFFIIGRKRGFTLEFFSIFKYLLVIYMMNYTYKIVKVVFRLTEKDSRDQLKIYVITFAILYIAFSILLILSSKFLKSIKLKKGDDLAGGFLGLIKTTFIIFIIYIIVLIGSTHSQRLRNIRNESFTIKGITEYGYVYSEVFPDFIKKDIDKYRRKEKEEKLKKSMLNELKENNLDKGIKKE